MGPLWPACHRVLTPSLFNPCRWCPVMSEHLWMGSPRTRCKPEEKGCISWKRTTDVSGQMSILFMLRMWVLKVWKQLSKNLKNSTSDFCASSDPVWTTDLAHYCNGSVCNIWDSSLVPPELMQKKELTESSVLRNVCSRIYQLNLAWLVSLHYSPFFVLYNLL